MALPKTKNTPQVSLAKSKTLIYGQPKVGKTTLAGNLLPDQTLFLGAEPGQAALNAYVQPVATWNDFLEAYADLSKDDRFKMVVIDTVDELLRLCADHVIRGLATTLNMDTKQYIHVGDFGYGKGQDAVLTEFRLRVGGLCHLMQSKGGGVIFLAHEKEEVVKERNGLEVSKFSPAVGMKGPRAWLLGFVDFIFNAVVVQTTDGEQRQLLLQPSEVREAGARMPEEVTLPNAVALDAKALKKAFRDANKAAAPVPEEEPAKGPNGVHGVPSTVGT